MKDCYIYCIAIGFVILVIILVPIIDEKFMILNSNNRDRKTLLGVDNQYLANQLTNDPYTNTILYGSPQESRRYLANYEDDTVFNMLDDTRTPNIASRVVESNPGIIIPLFYNNTGVINYDKRTGNFKALSTAARNDVPDLALEKSRNSELDNATLLRYAQLSNNRDLWNVIEHPTNYPMKGSYPDIGKVNLFYGFT